MEAHQSLDGQKRSHIIDKINHPAVERQLLAERAFLKKLEGGCSIPVFAHATLAGKSIQLGGGIFRLDGKIRIFHEVIGDDPIDVGITLAQKVLDDGGEKVLREIKKLLG